MPLYEYQCGTCAHRFEKIQKFSDPGPDACPACGGGPVTRMPSSPAIQFKGTGWYITDYAKKTGTDAGKSGAEKAEGGKSDGGKPDSGGTSDAGAKSDGGTKSDSGGKSDTGGKSDRAAASDTSSTPAPAPAKDTKSN
jgi:putative FmdB family regulatory protein